MDWYKLLKEWFKKLNLLWQIFIVIGGIVAFLAALVTVIQGWATLLDAAKSIIEFVASVFTSPMPLWSLVIILLGAITLCWLRHKSLTKRSNLEQQRQLEPYHQMQMNIKEMNFKGVIGSGKLFVCSAYYGIDTEWFNVTEKIRSAIDNNYPNIDVGFKLLSSEDGLPTIARQHRLILTYLYDKQFHALKGEEGQKLVFKADRIDVE